jgi:hypothetical protein
MNKRCARIHKHYTEFMFQLHGQTISQYFQIKEFECTLTKITPEGFTFDVEKESFPRYVFPTLPTELSMRISGFLYDHHKAEYILTFPEDYPFKPPCWSLLYANPIKKYTLAAIYLNKQYEHSWSPAITLEKDVLNMIVSISIH